MARDMSRALAPILSFTAEDVWRHLPASSDKTESIFLSGFPNIEKSWEDPGLAERWNSVREVRRKTTKVLESLDGIIIPGGFGKRGIEGKILSIRHARKTGIPFLGLCLGMQLMVIEYARDACGMEGANSEEFDSATKYPVIAILPEQLNIVEKGATMRLGAYPCLLKEKTKAWECYARKTEISERHRHRYEVNPKFTELLEQGGLVFSGRSPRNNIVEMSEWKEGFGIGTQAHPELKSRFEAPAPLFVGLIKAAMDRKKKMRGNGKGKNQEEKK
jgi:CTP synthase